MSLRVLIAILHSSENFIVARQISNDMVSDFARPLVTRPEPHLTGIGRQISRLRVNNRHIESPSPPTQGSSFELFSCVNCRKIANGFFRGYRRRKQRTRLRWAHKTLAAKLRRKAIQKFHGD